MLYWKKETESALLDPPYNFTEPDGTVIINFPMNESKLLQHGWTQWTAEQINAWEEAHKPDPTYDDYDKAIEAHLTAEQIARGYTVRSPIEYTNSTNTRWAQDAKDWQAHLDEVMMYGLDVLNKFKAGESVPSLQDFKALMPVITWTYQITE